MSATAEGRRVRARGAEPGASARTAAVACGVPADAWPHTRRPLPWLLAGFVALVFLVPIDSTSVRVHLPVDSHIDRLGVLILMMGWFWFGGDERTFSHSRRSKLFVAAVGAFCLIAVASVVLDGPRLINVDNMTLAEKKLATLAEFVAVGWFALTALRRADLRGFANFMIGLGCITAVGVLIERRTGLNVFYVWGGTLLHPIAIVAPSPTVIHPAMGTDGRVTVVGPTLHGLAVTAMFTSVMPFALLRMLDSSHWRPRFKWALVFGLLFAAAMSTDRKTAVVVPVAIIAYLVWYRPRPLLKLLPFGIVALLAVVHVTSPGAIGSIFSTQNVNSSSTEHRLGDFSGVMPDLLAHPLFGRGFGSFDINQPALFRINDDEYIDELDGVGILGLVAYLFMIIAPIIAARRTVREDPDPEHRSLTLALCAACVAFLVINGLFDALSFPQAPYCFFFVAAMATVATREPGVTGVLDARPAGAVAAAD